jgi:hypothetical protein
MPNLGTKYVHAKYRETGVSRYKGNPFVEALPPIMDIKGIRNSLRSSVSLNDDELTVSGSIRAHCIAGLLDDFFQPISSHVQLQEKLSIMIRSGYVGRNPINGSLNKHLQNGYERLMSGDLEVFRFEEVKSTAQSMSLIGCSGSGKTTTLTKFLTTYPQVIYHQEYNIEQVVYLKIDCSHNGSLDELCRNFFRAMDLALGTTYEKKYGKKGIGVPTKLAQMTQLANLHALGVLVIDEIQHLNRAMSGGSENMLNFFVTMVNTIGLPVILVGTPKAREIFDIDFRSARRSAGFGAIEWHPMPQHSKRGAKSEWEALSNKLWTFQWLRKRDLLLTDEIRDTWYDLSQGILDIVVKLFVLSQLRAIVTGTERITKEIMRQVYDDELKPVHPMLAALRSGDTEKILKFSDLSLRDVDKRVIQLIQKIEAEKLTTNKMDGDLSSLGNNENAKRLYLTLRQLGYETENLAELLAELYKNNPGLTQKELLPIIIKWLNEGGSEDTRKQTKSTNLIKIKDWNRLDSDDIRFIYSLSDSPDSLWAALQKQGKTLDLDVWLTGCD